METLDNVVREHLIEIGDNNLNRYARTLQYAISILRELNIDVSGVPAIFHLTVSDTDTVNLPHGYINYTRIALCDAGGNLHSLGINPNMCLNRSHDDCGNLKKETVVNGNSGLVGLWDWTYFSDNFRNGEFMGRFFGVGGGNNANGYYRIDVDNGFIQLQQLPSGTASLVLECICDLSMVNGNFLVHPFIIETVKRGIFWRSVKYNRSISLGEKQLAEQGYTQAYATAVRRYSAGTFQEWMQTFRISTQLTPKF